MERRPLLMSLALFGAAAGCSKPQPPVTNPANDAPIAAAPDTTKTPATTAAPRTEADDRAKSAANLKTILLADHNYHDVVNSLPWNNVYTTDPPVARLSWRVQILPFLGHEELYRKFKHNEPWDSAGNRVLIKEMPTIYAPVHGTAAIGETYYQVFVGPKAIWVACDSYRPGSIRDIMDGTANTFAVVEAGTPVVWTKPDDIRFDPAGPFPKLGGEYDAGFHAAMLDGQVYFVGRKADADVLKAAVTPNGGEAKTWLAAGFDNVTPKLKPLPIPIWQTVSSASGRPVTPPTSPRPKTGSPLSTPSTKPLSPPPRPTSTQP